MGRFVIESPHIDTFKRFSETKALLTVPGSLFHAASITKIKKQRHRELALCRCVLYTLYKPLTYYLLFCPVGVSGRRYTLPERS